MVIFYLKIYKDGGWERLIKPIQLNYSVYLRLLWSDFRRPVGYFY
ncbi:hypothetical protein [Nostoc sp.]